MGEMWLTMKKKFWKRMPIWHTWEAHCFGNCIFPPRVGDVLISGCGDLAGFITEKRGANVPVETYEENEESHLRIKITKVRNGDDGCTGIKL